MNLGIVGLGLVGGAIKYGFEKIGHKVKVYDLKIKSSRLKDVLHTEVCFVCVPTPSTEDGKCNTRIVGKTVDDLINLGYNGIIAIKSTVEPGTILKLQRKYHTHRICFVPEFLRERCAIADFVECHDICVIGADTIEIYETIKLAHGNLPKKFIKVTPSEAEFVKYFNNIYNATLVVLANSFYEVCQSCGVDYSNVKNAIINRDHITKIYLDVNEKMRGFAGACLIKDLSAICNLVKEKGLGVEFFGHLLEENRKYKPTVIEGMRQS